jgi:hypothetical protein
MSEKQLEDAHQILRRITIRWKVMLTLGTILIALGLFVDWPPSAADSSDTSSFLIIIGGLLGAAGLLTALRGE